MDRLLNCMNTIHKANITLRFLKITQTLIVTATLGFIAVNAVCMIKDKKA